MVFMDDSMPIARSTSLLHRRSKLQTLYHRLFPLGFKEEFIEVVKLAWPASATSFCQFFLQTVSIIMCGHLSKAELAAAALANSIINVLGISLGMGMSTACDTLFSQSYGGDNKKQVGVYLQRSLVIMNIVALLICCVHMNVEPILLLIGQNPEIARLSAQYMLAFLPGVFFDFNFLTLARYLQNQNIVWPPMVCAFVGNVYNILSQFICIYVLKFSYISSAICQASALGVMLVLEIIYIVVSKCYKMTWDGWSAYSTFRGWGFFLRLAIPGMFLIGLEEWSVEITTFVAGSIDTVQLAIQSIVFQVEAISYMIPLGMSIAVNVRVGQHLGANRAEHAKTASRVGIAMILMTATIMAVVIICLRNVLPYIFTNDGQVARGASEVLILNAGFQYVDGISATSAGALRGCGRQLTGAVILFFGYYVISLPIGISLALATPLKVKGLWIGLLIGVGLEAVTFLIVVSLTNWNKQCDKAALVAYGDVPFYETQSIDPNQRGSQLDPVSERGTTTEGDYSCSDQGEEEPLIKQRQRRHHRSISRGSRRASVAISSEEFVESAYISNDEFKRVLCKRLLFLAFVFIVLSVAITFRIFQTDPCVPLNNSTMAEYVGILPFCNETIAQ